MGAGVMDNKSVEVFNEKKAEVAEAGVQEHEGGGKDVISSLRVSNFPALISFTSKYPAVHAANSPGGLKEDEILAQIQTMIFA